MSRVPRLTDDQVIQALRKEGFNIARRKSSHIMLKHQDARGTVVPVHSGEIIGAGLMSKIQKDIGADREYLIRVRTVR